MSLNDIKKLGIAIVLVVLVAVFIELVGNSLIQPSNTIVKLETPIKKEAPISASQNTPVPIGPFLSKANLEGGRKQVKKCKSCHTVAKSGENKIGPALWDIVGREIGTLTTYKYSKALKHKEGNWNYEELNAFLANPKNYIKGTKMVFSGIKNMNDRANLIFYLRSLSETPKQ